MFLVYFNYSLAKLVIYFYFTEVQNRWISTLDRYGKHKNPYAHDNKIVDFYA